MNEEPTDWKGRALSAENKLSELEDAHAWSISPAMAQAKIDELNRRAEAAEKACAEMRAAIQLQDDNWGFHYNAQREIKAATSSSAGHTYISITDPVIVGLVGILLQRPMAYKRTHDDHYAIPITAWETFCVKVNEAIATYEARKKEAGV